jgi:cytochrome c oxidase cbb3-type subunit 2
MTRIFVLLMGALATVSFALTVLVILPSTLLYESKKSAPADLKPYSETALRGREIYMKNGCVYCHTQQVRDPAITTDVEKGLGGRPSYPGDYYYDKPHLLGTMRTGPDLFNIGTRLPDREWHLLHLYQPRALVPWSIMPSFPFLFKVKQQAGPDDHVLKVPGEYAPKNGVVVATPDAQALVDYLLSLKHEYPAPLNEPGEEVDATLPQEEKLKK